MGRRSLHCGTDSDTGFRCHKVGLKGSPHSHPGDIRNQERVGLFNCSSYRVTNRLCGTGDL